MVFEMPPCYLFPSSGDGPMVGSCGWHPSRPRPRSPSFRRD
jgi:hypothetical protein